MTQKCPPYMKGYGVWNFAGWAQELVIDEKEITENQEQEENEDNKEKKPELSIRPNKNF